MILCRALRRETRDSVNCFCMRICIVQDILPFHFEGGAQFLGWRTGTALAARGHDVTVVTARCPDHPPAAVVEGVHLRCLGSVPVHGKGFYRVFAREAFDGVVREQQDHFDIVQIRGWRTAGLVGQMSRRDPLSVPVLGHTSGLGFAYEFETRPKVLWEETPGTQARKLRRVLARKFYYLRDTFPMERAARYLDGFSTVTSRGLRLAHRLYGMPKRRLHLINDGIPAGSFRPPEIESNGHQLLYVGALVKRKGVHVLIHALQHVAREFPDLRLRIVGDGPEKQALHDLSSRLGVDEFVEFAGTLANERIPGAMQSCNVFVNPSISTVGYETVQIEAMLGGRLLVAPRTASNRMLITDGQEGLFYSPGSVRSLTQALLRGLTLAPRERVRIGAAARTRALREFTVERMGAMSEGVFQKVIEQFAVSGSHSK